MEVIFRIHVFLLLQKPELPNLAIAMCAPSQFSCHTPHKQPQYQRSLKSLLTLQRLQQTAGQEEGTPLDVEGF